MTSWTDFLRWVMGKTRQLRRVIDILRRDQENGWLSLDRANLGGLQVGR